MIKKILSPIIYIVFLVPFLIGTIWIITTVERTTGFLFDMSGFVELSFLILTLGTLLFWLANCAMAGFEKLLNPTSLDHFRQASLYYLIVVCTLTSLLRYGYHGGLGEAFLLMYLLISIWAIIINAIFLYRRYKVNSI